MPFLGDRLRITFKNVLEQYKSDKLGQITGGALFTLLHQENTRFVFGVFISGNGIFEFFVFVEVIS